MIFKSIYGAIKDDYLILYKVNNEMIVINAITEIKICKRQNSGRRFIDYFKKKLYDFTIIMDNQEKITFAFDKNHLPKILEFKTRIWHTKFSLRNSIPEKTNEISDILYHF